MDKGNHCKTVIIGAGTAGLEAAFCLAEYGVSNIKSGRGILIDSCQRVELTDNIVNKNAKGLVISDSSACDVTHNQISGNGEVLINIFFPYTPPVFYLPSLVNGFRFPFYPIS